jgi:hypothetical protein
MNEWVSEWLSGLWGALSSLGSGKVFKYRKWRKGERQVESLLVVLLKLSPCEGQHLAVVLG